MPSQSVHEIVLGMSLLTAAVAWYVQNYDPRIWWAFIPTLVKLLKFFNTYFADAGTFGQVWPLNIAGFAAVVLADLAPVRQRTALTGGAILADALVPCPGLATQQAAVDLNRAEYPACAALTSGYVFRVENPATVYFLQGAGRAGHLTTLAVKRAAEARRDPGFAAATRSAVADYAYLAAVTVTIDVGVLLYYLRDWWALVTLLMFVFCRACNVLVVRRRSRPGWFGQPEPGVKGDLLVLVSQDRWIRLQGDVDDLKAVTSSQWLRDPTTLESFVSSTVTVILYFSTAVAANARNYGQFILPSLLLFNTCMLAVANMYTTSFSMHERVVHVVGKPRKYSRRLELAKDLIEETGRDDWAVRMGIINARDSKSKASTDGGVIM